MEILAIAWGGLKAIFVIIGVIFSGILKKFVEEKLISIQHLNLSHAVKVLVERAEVLFHSEEKTGTEKKDYVLRRLQKKFKDVFSQTKLTDFIEASVYENIFKNPKKEDKKTNKIKNIGKNRHDQ